MSDQNESYRLLQANTFDAPFSPAIPLRVQVLDVNDDDVRDTRGFAFWMTFVAICLSTALFALELTSVSTALPTIVADLSASDFVWVGASYALASTAFLPMTGGLSDAFGRKPVIMASVLLFALGSALCGAAVDMNMLLVGRTVQGLGGGAIIAVADIILCDIVPLNERGIFFGLIGLTWALASAIGPLVGGSLANAGDSSWRWLFYLNLPICGVCIFVYTFFLDLKTPHTSLREKISRMDWIGNILVVGSSTAVAIPLTWGGSQFAWNSLQVIVPLAVGVSGFIIFLIYEELWATDPIVPFRLMSNRTSASGYLQNFFAPVVTLAIIYFLPVYYQACKGDSPLLSGLKTLGLASVALSAIVGGIIVEKSQRYSPPLWFGWCIMIVGTALLTTVNENTWSMTVIGFTVLAGCGIGLVYALAQFPVQAPLPISDNARSMAFFAFMRAFASIWGVTLGNAILQNELQRNLPAAFKASFPSNIALAYSVIPQISTLDPELQAQVRHAFAQGLQILWAALAGVAGAGLVVSFAMKEVPMHTVTDERWDLTQPQEGDRGVSDVEQGLLNPSMNNHDGLVVGDDPLRANRRTRSFRNYKLIVDVHEPQFNVETISKHTSFSSFEQ